MGWAATPESKSLSALVGLWFTVTACLLVALMLVAIERVAANDFRIASVDLVDLATTAGPGADDTIGLDKVTDETDLADSYVGQSGPPVPYGGTAWSVVGSRLIPRTEEVGSRPIVVVDAVVSNTTAATIRTKTSDVAMLWPDGRRDQVDRFEFVDDSAVVTLEPGESSLVTLVFKPLVVVDPILEELQLEVGEPGRVPARLPLLGPAPVQRYPAPAAIDGPAAVMADPIDMGRQLAINPVTASVALDAGPYRVAIGSRLAIVEVAVERGAVLIGPVADTESAAPLDADTSILQPEFWQLRNTDHELHPMRVIDNGESVSLVFVVDERADNMVLVVAANGSQARTFAVELPVLVE